MKQFLSYFTFLLLSITIFFSCKKIWQTTRNTNTQTYPTAIVSPDSCGPPSVIYAGKEFIFGASWQVYVNPGNDIFEGIFGTIEPSDSFSISDMVVQNRDVFIKLDSSSDWILVPQWKWYPFIPGNGSQPFLLWSGTSQPSSTVPIPSGNYFWCFNKFTYCKKQFFCY